jgi:cobalt-zinc-cadmium efflux system outer membrane protein
MISSLIARFLLGCGVVASAPFVMAQEAPAPLTLNEAVRLYLDRNLEVEAARLAVERTRAGQIGARLRPNPGITATAENFRLGGSTPFERLYEVAVSYSERIELGGKRRLRTEVADLAVEAAEAELTDTLRKGVAEVQRLYYETVLALENVGIAMENRDAFERLVEYNEVRFENGAVPEADLIKVRLERVQFDAVLRRAQLDLRQSMIRLVERIGETDYQGRTVVGELVFNPMPFDLEFLKQAALDSRPDVAAARLRLERTGTELRLEEARGTPDLEPFVGYKRVASSDTILFGLSLPIPFRDRNQGGIARAASEERIAEAELGAVRNRVLAEVEAAYAAYQTARDQVLMFENELLGPADRLQQIALVAYEEGATELLPLLDAQRTEAAVRQSYFRMLFDFHASLIDLELAVGREIRP